MIFETENAKTRSILFDRGDLVLQHSVADTPKLSRDIRIAVPAVMISEHDKDAVLRHNTRKAIGDGSDRHLKLAARGRIVLANLRDIVAEHDDEVGLLLVGFSDNMPQPFFCDII